MKTIASHPITSIAAIAAALLVSGTAAQAREVYRTNGYCAPRAAIEVRSVRPVERVPVRPGITVYGPERCAAPVCAVAAPRAVVFGHVERIEVPCRSYAVWGRR